MAEQDKQKIQDHKQQADEVENVPGYNDMNVLDLPSRKQVHSSQTKKKKTTWKLSTIWLRFLLVSFLILVSLILSYSYWDEWFGISKTDPVSVDTQQKQHEEVTVIKLHSD